MRPTEEYVETLTGLKQGDLSLLRAHAGHRLDHTIGGFDLFTGLWWPLRQKTPAAPRRQVAWLIATLYACYPLPHEPGMTLARQLRNREPSEPREQERFRRRFDWLLSLPLADLQPALSWALGRLSAAPRLSLDWVNLTDDLSAWERSSVRQKWAEQFLGD